MPIVPILIGIALVVGAIALAMSGTTWRWYHITLTALIMVFSAVWFYLAARMLMIEKAWRTEVNAYELAVHQQEVERERLLKGYQDDKGEHVAMDVLKTEVEKMLQGRGRIWGAIRKAVAADGKVTATLPEGIAPPEAKTILWAFDDPSVPNGQFQGEFEV